MLAPFVLAFALLLVSPASVPATPWPLGDIPLPPDAGVPPKLRAALDALRKGSVEEALQGARKFVSEEPRHAVGHELLGAAAAAKGDTAEAERALTEALRLDPRRPYALLWFGRRALATDPKKAEELFRRAIEVVPTLPVAHRYLALALLRQGQVQQGIAKVQESLKLAGGNDPDSKYLLAAVYFELGRLPDAEQILTEVLNARPDATAPLLLQAMVKLESRKPDDAAVLFQKVVQRDRKSPWARLGLSIIARSSGQVDRAREALEALTKEEPRWALAHFQLGETLLMTGQRDAALTAFGRSEELSPDAALARVRTGQVLLAYGDSENAAAKARAAMRSPAAATPARLLLVDSYLAKGDRGRAERELQSAAAAAGRDPVWPIQLGRFYLAHGRPKDALTEFQKASKLQPESVDALRGQAEAYALLDQRREALDATARVLKLAREAPSAYVFAGDVETRLGRTEEALKAYQKALERERHHVAATRALAALHERAGRRPEAARLLQELAAARPDLALPLVDLGNLHQRSGKTAAAIDAYRQALLRAPNDPALLNNLAYLLSADSRNLDEALPLAERAYQRAPTDAAIVDTVGWLQYRKGNLGRARELLGQAVRLDPSNPVTRYHLGVVYAKEGRKADARRELELALQSAAFANAAPEAEDARGMLKSLP